MSWVKTGIVIARFVPQAWINDYAVDVDPEGDTEWDATAEFGQMPADYRADLLEELRSEDEVIDNYDWLKSDPNAPEWVREWSGPFSIWVRLDPDRIP